MLKKPVMIMVTLYKKLLWTILVLLSVHLSTAQERVSKTIERNFSLSSAGELQLENKYGDIRITGWDKEQVLVKIEIRVNRRKKENAKELLGRINPKFKTSDKLISISSEISNKNTGWFADFFNRTNPIDVDRSRVQIAYEIFLPQKAQLKVTNRFGDVLVEDWSGELDALIEHGDLWISDHLNRAKVLLKFGKLKAQNLNYARLNLKNGELDMGNSKDLQLTSSGTEIGMGTVNSLEIYSNKDDIILDEVGTMYGNLKFSTLILERLTQDVDLSMKIADFKVASIASNTAEIAIEQESSDIDLKVTDFPHRFEATLEQGLVRLPKSFQNVDSKMLDKGKKLREIAATYGKDRSGTITIKGIKGIVTLRE